MWKGQFLCFIVYPSSYHLNLNLNQKNVLFLQTLAIYDRFGRLMLGSEDIPKDVLEYVVFEKHLSGMYGSWRIHGKITPEWATLREPIVKTLIEPKEEDDKDNTEDEKWKVFSR